MARGIWSGVNPIGPRGVAVVRRADHGPERHNHGPFGNSVNIRNEPWCYGLSLLLAARYGLSLAVRGGLGSNAWPLAGNG
jgi:hypothetical protein